MYGLGSVVNGCIVGLHDVQIAHSSRPSSLSDLTPALADRILEAGNPRRHNSRGTWFWQDILQSNSDVGTTSCI